MSRIKRFRGSVDGVGEGSPHPIGFVVATTPGLPEWGFVKIPLCCFSRRDRAILAEIGPGGNVRVEGRVCPRSMRVRIVG